MGKKKTLSKIKAEDRVPSVNIHAPAALCLASLTPTEAHVLALTAPCTRCGAETTGPHECPKEPKVVPRRRHLAEERQSITHRFSIAGFKGYLIVGLYEDGTPGELFLHMSKEGSTVSGLCDTWATTFSLALQYGVPLKALVEKFKHVRFEPSGYTETEEIKEAASIPDYVVRWLELKFLSGKATSSNGSGRAARQGGAKA